MRYERDWPRPKPTDTDLVIAWAMVGALFAGLFLVSS
jgi:hypothetical protein